MWEGRETSPLQEVYRTVLCACRPKELPQCVFVSHELYAAAYDELKETELAKERGVLCADIPFMNFLVGGIPIIPIC